MGDEHISAYKFIPTLPTDYQPAVQYLWDAATDVASGLGQKVLKAAGDLAKAKGDPDKLLAGATILKVDVAGAVGQARGAIERGNASFTTAWIGRGAEAFANYVPLLTAAIKAVEDSAIATADAVNHFALALKELWNSIILATIDFGKQVVGAINAAPGDDDGKKKKNAFGSVMVIIESFVGFARDIVAALMKIDIEKYHAFDKLSAAAKTPSDLVDVGGGPTSGRAAMHYMGPTGWQLPVPNATAVDPDWDPTQIKDRWKPKSEHSPAFSQVPGGRGVEIDTQMMQELIDVFRKNGEHWNRALTRQIDATLNNFHPDSFGFAGKDFHARLQKVLIRDYILYLHSDARMDALGDLLDRINEAYGASDQQSSNVLREYITNEPVL
jgi:hypothetical protein